MFKIDFHMVIYRYEVILAAIILLLTGGIAVSSRNTDNAFPPEQRYPYRIALTFDDGPHVGYTKKLIDVLSRYNAKATFFVVGIRLEQNPELAKQLSNAGHEIENHTYNHKNLAHLNDSEIEEELMHHRMLIRNITHRDSCFFRPPGGQYDTKVVDVAYKNGLSMILWTVFTKDHDEKDPKIIVQRALDQATDGGVVLLHSGSDATVAALPAILKELNSRGYKFVTVADLYRDRKTHNFAWLVRPRQSAAAMPVKRESYL